MGMIGRWIDSLTDEQRDRIIEHPDPTYDGEYWWDDKRDCGCLVGAALVAEEWVPGFFGLRIPARVADTRRKGEYEVGNRFFVATSRFTAPRMWRVVKARAARANRIELLRDLVASEPRKD